jgi:hypothetical protein
VKGRGLETEQALRAELQMVCAVNMKTLGYGGNSAIFTVPRTNELRTRVDFNFESNIIHSNRDSSVGTATGYGLEGRSLLPGRGK